MDNPGPSTGWVAPQQIANYTTNMQKLNGTNFLPWKRQVEIILTLRGLIQALTDDEVDGRTDMQATLVLLESMDDAHRIQVQAETSAKAIMGNLKRQYADTSANNKHQLLADFFGYKKIHSDTLNMHFGRLKEMRATLASLGEKMSEDLFQIALIRSLPDEFSDTLREWNRTHPSLKTTEFLCSCIQQRGREIEKSEEVLVATRKQFKDMTIAEKKRVTNCAKCHKRGHWAKECPQVQASVRAPVQAALLAEEDKDNEQEEFDIVLNIGNIDSTLKNEWVADSGATNHMANNLDWFVEYQQYPMPKWCVVGNGAEVEILGVGKVELLSKVDNRVIWVELQKVLYIPQLTTNLLSIGACTAKGLTATFSGDSWTLNKGGLTVVVGKRVKDSLYKLSVVPKGTRALVVENQRKLSEWHRALGHASKERITKLAKGAGIQIIDDEIECADCAIGKGKRVPHPAIQPRAQTIGEMVHVDLSGKINKPSIDGYYYFMVCKDEVSEFVFTYMMTTKDQVWKAIMQLIVDFETESGNPIKCIQTDNGSEFVNESTKLMLARAGIKHVTTAPYTPAQNGRVEREMQSISSMARAMLLAAQVDQGLWSEAVRAACYIRNRLPTSNNHLTPFERFTKRTPFVGHILEWGTQVYLIKTWCHKAKFDERSEEGIIVGFTPRRNTYRVYILRLGRTIETSDIIVTPHKKQPEAAQKEPDKITFDLVGNQDSEEPNTTENEAEHSEEERPILRAPETPRKPILRSAPQTEIKTPMKPKLNYPAMEFRKIDHPMTIKPLGHLSSAAKFPNPEDERALVMTEAIDETLPSSFEEAEESEVWMAAVEAELEVHRQNQTWEIVAKPMGQKTISTKWVFSKKRDSTGKVTRHKARLVARGFDQRPGLDFMETFAPVASIKTLRTLLALCVSHQMELTMFDVTTAFLHGNLTETVYIDPPKGIRVENNQGLRLNKALYGLKQAPRAWYMRFIDIMKELGYTATHTDQCVFRDIEGTTLVMIYVDDGLILSKTEGQGIELLKQLSEKIPVKQTIGKFLGLNITYEDNKIIVNKTDYCVAIAKKYELDTIDTKITSPLLNSKDLFKQDEDEQTTEPYREALGAIQYLANSCRPDIQFATNYLSRFSQCPTNKHWLAVKRLIKYIYRTRDYSISYCTGPLILDAYSDASWANDELDRRSTSGILLKLAGGPIVFDSRKQSCVAMSTAESEFIAASETAMEIASINNLLSELGACASVKLHIDNLAAIQQIKALDSSKRSKHIDIKFHYVKQLYIEKQFELQYIPTHDQPADILTKEISGPRVKEILETCNIGPQ